MKTATTITLFCLFCINNLFSQTAPDSCTSVFISAYHDGAEGIPKAGISVTNKAIAIFNSSSEDSVDLYSDRYQINVYPNGSTTPDEYPLSGELLPKHVYIVANNQIDSDGMEFADSLIADFYFNGNDAVALMKNGTAVDIIGEIGVDPGGDGWQVDSPGSTVGHTLVRKEDVVKGNTDWDNEAEDEYKAYPYDDMRNWRTHHNRCGFAMEISFDIDSSAWDETYSDDLPVRHALIRVNINQPALFDVRAELVLDSFSCAEIRSADYTVDWWYQTGFPLIITFPEDSSSPQYFPIFIFNDEDAEGNEHECFELRSLEAVVNPDKMYHQFTIVDDESTGISDAMGEGIKLFPTIANEQIFIETNQPNSTYKILITDITGQNLMQSELYFKNKKLKIDIGDLRQGFYIINVMNGSSTLSKKFIKF